MTSHNENSSPVRGQRTSDVWGILVLDKPAGITSARALDAVKRLLPRGTRVGHAGTLDPFATGVLLVLVGRATKSCEALMDQPKTYEGTVKLGATTETDDPDSPERFPPHPVTRPGVDFVRDTIRTFTGSILQKPPAYSALKIAGRRASDRAREGQAVELEARTVQVYAIELLEYTWPLLRLRVDCGRGTYVRAIARDLGESLETGGYLTQLRRTRVGQFDLSRAVTVEQLQQGEIESRLLRL